MYKFVIKVYKYITKHTQTHNTKVHKKIENTANRFLKSDKNMQKSNHIFKLGHKPLLLIKRANVKITSKISRISNVTI